MWEGDKFGCPRWYSSLMLRIALLVVAAVTALACADDWPQFRGPLGDGVAREAGLNLAWPAEGPRKLWSAPLGDGGGGTHAGVAVAQGKVFAPGRTGQLDALYCLDAASGRELWKHEFEAPGRREWGSGPRATPTVSDGRVAWSLDEMGKRHAQLLRVGEDKLIVLREEGEAVLVEDRGASGAAVARFQAAGADAFAAPALSSARLFIRDSKTLHCFDLKP